MMALCTGASKTDGPSTAEQNRTPTPSATHSCDTPIGIHDV